jgi:crotonobetainyl-CoA:carnitine CoA-transferase CaiB-like acyl-CoA transferase
MGDTGNGMLAAIAITQALYHRERTGRGQAVSTSIVNACLLNSSYAWIHADGTPGDWNHVDAGQYGLGPYYRLYEVSDGWVFVAAVTEDDRGRLHDALEVDVDSLAEELAKRSAIDAFKVLDSAGVPVEIVDESFCRDLFDDPEAAASGLVATSHAGSVGRFEDPGLLVQFSETPGVVQRGPCMCGEHTREILEELGYDNARIDELAAERVILIADTGATSRG